MKFKNNLMYFLLSTQFIFSNFASAVFQVPDDRVMSVKEFEKALDNNDFLRAEGYTTRGAPLDDHEIDLINLANSNQGVSFGGIFDVGRDIEGFYGSTLLVGGGKTTGPNGENDGKMILLDHSKDIEEMYTLIEKLRSGELDCDPYLGKKFYTAAEKNAYIASLESKISLYQKASSLLNEDILSQYYTLNIEPKICPDMLASITSEEDMSKVPDNKFSRVEFENVPCDVFLDPKLYQILSRITKTGGKIAFSISYPCRRLIVPVIERTKYGNEFKKKLKADVYADIDNMDRHYGSYYIELTNF